MTPNHSPKKGRRKIIHKQNIYVYCLCGRVNQVRIQGEMENVALDVAKPILFEDVGRKKLKYLVQNFHTL